MFVIDFIKPYLELVKGNFFPAFINLFSKVFTKFHDRIIKELDDYVIPNVETEIVGSVYDGETNFSDEEEFKIVYSTHIPNFYLDRNNITEYLNNKTNGNKEIVLNKIDNEEDFIYDKQFRNCILKHEDDYSSASLNFISTFGQITSPTLIVYSELINKYVYDKKIFEYHLYFATNGDNYVVCYYNGDRHVFKTTNNFTPIYVEPTISDDEVVNFFGGIQYKEEINSDSEETYIRYFNFNGIKLFFYENFTGYGIQWESNGEVSERREVVFNKELFDKIFKHESGKTYDTDDFTYRNFHPVLWNNYLFFVVTNYERESNTNKKRFYLCYINLSRDEIDNNINVIDEFFIDDGNEVIYIDNFWGDVNFISNFQLLLDKKDNNMYLFKRGGGSATLFKLQLQKFGYLNTKQLYFNDYFERSKGYDIVDSDSNSILSNLKRKYFRSPLSMFGYYQNVDRKEGDTTFTYRDKVHKTFLYPNLNGNLGIFNNIAITNDLQVKQVNNLEVLFNIVLDGQININESDITFSISDRLENVNFDTIDDDNNLYNGTELIGQIERTKFVFDTDYIKNNYPNQEIEVELRLNVSVDETNNEVIISNGRIYYYDQSYTLGTNLNKEQSDLEVDKVLTDLDYIHKNNWKWNLNLDIGGESNLVGFKSTYKLEVTEEDKLDITYGETDFLPLPLKYPYKDISYFKKYKGINNTGFLNEFKLVPLGTGGNNNVLLLEHSEFNNIELYKNDFVKFKIQGDSDKLKNYFVQEIYLSQIYLSIKKEMGVPVTVRVEFFSKDDLDNNFDRYVESFFYFPDNDTDDVVLFIRNNGFSVSGVYEIKLISFDRKDVYSIDNDLNFIDNEYLNLDTPNVPLILETNEDIVDYLYKTNKVKYEKKWEWNLSNIPDRSFINKSFLNENKFVVP